MVAQRPSKIQFGKVELYKFDVADPRSELWPVEPKPRKQNYSHDEKIRNFSKELAAEIAVDDAIALAEELGYPSTTVSWDAVGDDSPVKNQV